MPIVYCSYFDHRYLSRAICLYESLKKYSPAFVWHVLPLSPACARALEKLSFAEVKITTLEELERAWPSLLNAKQTRSIVEYYFTLTSVYCSYLSQTQILRGEFLHYLDADLYFFNSPCAILEELENSSIGIIEHRFGESNREKLAYGRFNVGWLSFRNDEFGRRCLSDWTEKCLDWCYDRLENERFADQKYLDAWPSRMSGVHIIEHDGANVAPWNIEDFPMEQVESRLIFAHFQNLRSLGFRTFETGFDIYRVPVEIRQSVAEKIYRPYLRHLWEAEKRVRLLLRGESGGQVELRQSKRLIKDWRPRSLLNFPGEYLRKTRMFEWITI